MHASTWRATSFAIHAFLFFAAGTNALRAADEPASDDSIRPFRIAVEESVLQDLQDRLVATRWPDQIEQTGWDYGVPVDYMREFVEYWWAKYDWRKQERKLNELEQFMTTIDGLEIHFVHVRSKEKDALPLILIHGWPGSFVEFQKIIGPLVDPVAHGGRAAEAFHVVCPSLPGFGFSSKPDYPGWNSPRMAEVLAKLMSRLGYDRYGAQGGDLGAGMANWLTQNDSRHCIGGHSNFPPVRRPREEPLRDVAPEEIRRFEERQKELMDHKGFGAIQSTRPLTLGYGLNDSPAGLAAWIVDKFWAWSDHDRDLDNSFTKDELITNVMIYWVTETMPSSTRIYFESARDRPRPRTMTPFETSDRPSPMGYALFPKEINVPPKAWVERATGGELFHWTEMPRGGHFAAMEVPELLVEDVRVFFGRLRSGSKPAAPETDPNE